MITAFVLCGTAACLNSAKSGELEAVQVKEYNGEKLGSINDFRENSIKGPQQVGADALAA